MTFAVISERATENIEHIFSKIHRDRYTTKSPKGGLRILTLNTWLDSFIFEFKDRWGDIINNPIGSYTKYINRVTGRAEQIAGNILSSGYDYDIIVLNEVFSEAARSVLISKLSTEYPYFLDKFPKGPVRLPTEVVAAFRTLVPVLSDIFYALSLDLGDLGEDSGLMFFSRFPIIDSRFKQFTFPSAKMWAEAVADSLAAKGVAFARVLDPNTRALYNFVLTHLQENDDEKPGWVGVRNMELEQIQNFITDIMTDYEISSQDLFLMGDLNISGNWKQAKPLKDPSEINNVEREIDKPEWISHFQNSSSFFTKKIHDTWFYETSTMDKGYTTTGRQRIDHILHNPVSLPQMLVVQHLTLAYNLMGPDGKLNSDHYGINADLNLKSENCSPRDSFVIPKGKEYFDGEIEPPGSMRWYRVDEPGTYSIAVRNSGDVEYAIYSSADLTLPLSQYKEETREFEDEFERKFIAKKYVMTEPPYYIRVFISNRTRTDRFTLFVHRHAGTSKEDSITMYNPNEYYPIPTNLEKPDTFPHVFPKDDRLNPDDTVWFDFDTLRADSGEPKDIECEVSKFSKAIYRMHLYKDDGKSLNLIDSIGPKSSKLTLTINDDIGPSKIYLLVTRHDTTFPSEYLAAMWKSNLTIFHGMSVDTNSIDKSQKLQLVCEKDSEPHNGADEITIKIWVDGKQMIDSYLGEFVSGTPYTFPDTGITGHGFRYLREIIVTLDEKDFWHDDSSGPYKILPLVDPRPTPVPQAQTEIKLEEEGKYTLRYNLSWQVPGKT